MPSSLLSAAAIAEIASTPSRVYTSYLDLRRDCQKWRNYRDLQEKEPLKESFCLQSPVTVPLKTCPSSKDVSAGRLLPPLLRLPTDRSEGMFLGKLVLNKRLRDEEMGRADIWLADVVGMNDQDSKASVGRVVLKIAQQSRMPIPDTSDPNIDLSEQRVWHPITLVAHDFFVFEKLQCLQGRVIPYSFGLHKIEMPNGEDAYVFITEYVEGRTLAAWMVENAHPAELPVASSVLTEYFNKGAPMIPRLLNAIRILHENSVKTAHCDLGDAEHVLLTDSGAGVVFVNFHSAITEGTLKETETMDPLTDWEKMELLGHVTDCCPVHKRMFGRWMRVRDMHQVIPAASFFQNIDLSDEGPNTEQNEFDAMRALRASGHLDRVTT
ncbi:hypothetical protein BDZ89DRAFT_1167915 [Hymenopellis radicata]|nr:hypothetical protein BDZ89DRAFT_1167915 [Hymenopellis radicata]